MIPRLFESNSTDFSSNGIGPLRDGSGWSVRQTVNREYELQFSYPRTGARFQDIVNRAIVIAKPDPISDEQAFRIYRVVKSLGSDTVTVYANHISYDLSGYPVAPFAAQDVGTAMAGLAGNLMVSSPFQLRTTKTTIAQFSLTKPCSARSVLGGIEGSILDTYRGEYEFDNFQVTLMDRRGADRGVSIRYGKNLTTLEQDANCAQVYTAVVPYWESEQEETVVGDLIPVPGTFDYDKVLPLDLSAEFESKPTKADLKTKAQSYIQQNELGIPNISWNIEFQTLEKCPEYKGKALLESIYLGDTVEVVFDRMNISAKARAVSVDYNPMEEHYNSVTLGKVKSSITDTIITQSKELEKKPTKSMVYQISEQLSQAMLGINGGCVRLLDTNSDGTPDELYIADNSNPAQALKVWRFNYEGWAVSKTGYDGPYTMGATIKDGLLADFVTAANLVAGTIQSADGETFYLNLDEGILKVSSSTKLIDQDGEEQDIATKQDLEDIEVIPGPPGTGISSAIAYYYLSTSSTSRTGGSWSTTIPAWVDGKYYWQKFKTTYTDGTTAETTPVCITGAKGADGAQGTGVSAIESQFYLSTSKTSPTGGSWQTDMPVWSSGKYLWTRNKITYSNPASVKYTEPMCDSSWEAIYSIEVGSRNLLPHSKEMEDWRCITTIGSSTNVGAIDTDDYGYGVYKVTAESTNRNKYVDSRPTLNFVAAGIRGREVTLSWDARSSDYQAINSSDGTEGMIAEVDLCTPDSTTRKKYRQKYLYANKYPLTDKWMRYSATFRLDDDLWSINTSYPDYTIDQDTMFYARVYAYCYHEMEIRKIKLEVGNIASDWSLSPDDIADNLRNEIETVNSTLSSQSADIIETSEGIIQSALANYVGKSDDEYIKFQRQVKSTLSTLSYAVNMDFEDSVVATLNKKLGDLNSSFSDLSDTISKHIGFSVDGITITGGGDIALNIDNTGITFTKDENPIGTWDGNNFYTGNIVVRVEERAQFGNFAFVPRSDGSLSLLKVQ